MLSTSMQPYLDAELAYRLERLTVRSAYPSVRRHHRSRLWPALNRTTRLLAHRPSPSH